MATGAFAVPSMKALCNESEHFEIVCLVATPLKHDKHGLPIITPARQTAKEYGIPISEHEDINSKEFFDFLYLVRPDLIFVCDFGQILSKQTLSGAVVGGINLHGSLLPKFRGAAPVHWAILTGEQHTGVSIIHMTPQIDAGPVIAQSPPLPIAPRETVIELEERLAQYGADLVFDVVVQMAKEETVRIIEQLHDRVSKAPRLKKESGFVPWERSSREIFNHFRAMVPWPRAFTDWHRTHEYGENRLPVRLILGKMTPLDDLLQEIIRGESVDEMPVIAPALQDAKMLNLAKMLTSPTGAMEQKHTTSQHLLPFASRPAWWRPGLVIHAEGDMLIVAAGEGAVRIEQIQPSGRKMMSVQDFLHGYPMSQGDMLGNSRRDSKHALDALR